MSGERLAAIELENRLAGLEVVNNQLQSRIAELELFKQEALEIIKNLEGHSTAKVQFPHKDCPELNMCIDEARKFLEKWR